MKVGNLVKCMFQPKAAGWDDEKMQLIPMKFTIKDELGLYINHDKASGRGSVLFPQFGYEHILAWSQLQVISESR